MTFPRSALRGRRLVTAIAIAGLAGSPLAAVLSAPGTAGAASAPGPNAVVAFGSASGVSGAGDVSGMPGPNVSIAATPDGNGYWVAAADGGVFSYGDARFFGSMGGHPLNEPVVGMAAMPTGGGYWEVAADGGIFSFGNARFYGSMGGHPLNQPVVGMAATPTGGGYWEVAADGGIFSFGAATFYGSMGGHPLNQPVVGMAAVPGGGGYWEVAADGGIFSFGAAPFYGSTGGMDLSQPVQGMAAVPGGGGYWLVAADGGIFSFGDAQFYGSGTGSPITAPALAMTARPGGYWILYGQTASLGTPLGQEEILARLGYLPLTWTPQGFAWRWAGVPGQLTRLWTPGQYNTVLEGAIWAFEAVVGLPMDGQISGPEIAALTAAAQDPSANMNPNGYTYSLAQEASGTPTPETLTVWHTGVVVQSTPANTGIASTPTAIGTFPVYIRYRNQVMTGLNPTGTPYADPVQYVSYFTGGDAIHYMPRAQYGYPQSLGCVEIPLGPASIIWQYTYYGSLVTVTPN